MPNVEVLTSAEFRERSRVFWLFGTGAGAALFAGALLGLIVGTVIVGQTLYSSTKDHLDEFATLRAMGSSNNYIYGVIIYQALLNAVVGFCLAAVIGFAVVAITAEGALPVVITPGLMAGDLRAHRGDVRRLGARRHPARRAHRSRHGVHAMNDPVIRARGHQQGSRQRRRRGAGLEGVSLSLRGGEVTLLIGPSGSGKTTLLSMLGCMLAPTSGTVHIRGISTQGADSEQLAKLRREHIGFVFQNYHLFPTLTAVENVQLALDVRGEHGVQARNKSAEALAKVGLSHKLRSYPRN